MEDNRVLHGLIELADRLVRSATDETEDILEGRVMTVGPPPYRRLDCDGRALAYIRQRPKKRAVRVDVSGLWVPDPGCPLCVPSAGGATSVFVHNEHEALIAAMFLRETVARTRRVEDAQRANALGT